VALVIDSVERWRPLVTELPDAAASLAAEFWPGPLSIALPAAHGVDERLVVDKSVAVRIPGPSPALDLVRAFGAPLTATSANLAGEPALCTAAEVHALLGLRCPDLFVMSDAAPGGPPSTLVRLENGRWVVLRPGAIDLGRLPGAVS
jgi:tRNA threonylcarbamoyl adenosine modification protein (Sua5/YciO/YrdC/YwlC family)